MATSDVGFSNIKLYSYMVNSRAQILNQCILKYVSHAQYI